MATLQWDYVLNDGFQLYRLQMHVATRFFSVECPGSRRNLPESYAGKPTQGATNGLGKPSDEKHQWHSAEPVWQSRSYFGAYISCGFWHSGTGFGDCVRLRNRTLPCKFFQGYSERTILTALFWILHLGIYGGIRWTHLCPVGQT